VKVVPPEQTWPVSVGVEPSVVTHSVTPETEFDTVTVCGVVYVPLTGENVEPGNVEVALA
jgi:hypothetical protein